MQIGTANGLRSRVFAGSNPAWGTTSNINQLKDLPWAEMQRQLKDQRCADFSKAGNCRSGLTALFRKQMARKGTKVRILDYPPRRFVYAVSWWLMRIGTAAGFKPQAFPGSSPGQDTSLYH